MPDHIRKQLYAEEQQDVKRQRKRRASSRNSYSPINITNVLPPQASTQSSSVATSASTEIVPPTTTAYLEIQGPLDVAVKRYTEWQCSRVAHEGLKIEYHKACALTLADELDLELVFEDQNAEFYIKKGVKNGIARRFVRDIESWAKHHNTA